MVPTTAPNLGFLLAKAAQRWNELLAARFASAGYAEVRPAHGSVLMPLFAEPAQRIGELTRQARVSKQTMTSLLVQIERDGLIERVRDPHDGRSTIVVLSARGRRFQLVAEEILADLDALVAEAVTPDALATTRTTLKELVELCEAKPSRPPSRHPPRRSSTTSAESRTFPTGPPSSHAS